MFKQILSLVAAVVLMAATFSCGGDNSTESNGASDSGGVEPAVVADDGDGDNDAGPVGATRNGIDVPEGVRVGDGLIAELEAIPVPDSPVAFSIGSAYTKEQDPQQTAVQMLFFTMPIIEVAEFYLRELPAAGFQIVSNPGIGAITAPGEIVPEYNAIAFIDPDGLPGALVITPGVWSATKMNINLSRSGTR